MDFKCKYDNIPKFVTYLFAFHVVAWWLEIGKRIDFFAAIRSELLIGAILGVIGLNIASSKSTLLNKKKKIDSSGLIHSLYIFIIVFVISLPLSIDFQRSWGVFIDRVIKFACMTFFISTFVKSPKHMKIFFLSCFAAFMKIGFESFLGKVTGSRVWENQGVMRLHGEAGTMFGHPNSLSGKTISTLPFVYYILALMNKYWKLILLIYIVFAINIIIFTASRTGYLTFLFFVIYLIWRSEKKKMICFVTAVLCIITVLYIPLQYKERFLSAFTGEDKEGHSSDARKGLLEDSIEVFFQNPLGVGIGCFRVAQMRAGRRAQETHNLYTQILSEIGIQGFLAFFWLIHNILLVIKKLKAFFRKCHDKIYLIIHLKNIEKEQFSYVLGDIRFLMATVDSLYMFIMLRLVLGVFGHDLFEIYWWIVTGILISLINMSHVIQNKIDEIFNYYSVNSNGEKIK